MATNEKPKQPAGAATTAGPGGALPPVAPAPPVLPAPAASDTMAQKQLDATRAAATKAVETSAKLLAASVEGGNRKTVTGVDSALVTVKKPDGSLLYSAVVLRGQDVPVETSEVELDRLERLGVFAPPAVVPVVAQTEAERLAARLSARG